MSNRIGGCAGSKQASNSQTGRTATRRWHPVPPRADGQAIARHFQRRQRWQWTGIALLLIFCRPLPAQQEIPADVTPSQMQSGSLLLKMQNGYQVATRMNTDASMSISGLIARVSVRQSFRNDGTEWVEGVYVFPLPDTAAVDRLRMYIGERFIEGEIREKEQAKKEYEQAKQEGKKASLVEQERPNLFTTSVANIGPGEAVTVEIEYLETLRYEEGTFSMRFPVTMTPRYIPGTPLTERKGSGWSPDTTQVGDASRVTPPVVAESTSHQLTVTVDLDAGMPLEIVASRYHPIKVSEIAGSDKGGRYRITLADPLTPMDHDFELIWRPSPDTTPRATLFTENFAGQPHLLLMMIPPNDTSVALPRIPRETILIIDTSGSMHGVSIEQARKALELALDGLRPEDRFNVIQFNSVTHALFRVSVPATLDNLDRARNYVQNLSADGGTEMRPALELALHSPAAETHLKQIIFITDGSVGNEQELFALIEASLGNARLVHGRHRIGTERLVHAQGGRGGPRKLHICQRLARNRRKDGAPVSQTGKSAIDRHQDPVAGRRHGRRLPGNSGRPLRGRADHREGAIQWRAAQAQPGNRQRQLGLGRLEPKNRYRRDSGPVGRRRRQ